MWTEFWDMSSGGGQKEDFQYCYIEESKENAKKIFYKLFGHNPERVTCTCCGQDYSIDESEKLEDATAYHRGAKWVDDKKEKGLGHYESGTGKSIEEFEKRDDVKIIRKSEFPTGWKDVEIPDQGYRWV